MPDFDYVIIGAGSAGCVLANRLSADPAVRVLLLEAGGSDRNPMISAPGGLLPLMVSGAYAWRYQSAPQRHLDGRVLYMPRGKVLGGSSSINGMVYCRGARGDFDRWRQLGNEGWSYEDVLPYFKRTETHVLGESDYHGGSGPVHVSRTGVNHPFAKAFVEAGQQAGYPYNDDTNGASREGFGPVDITVWNGRRSSSSAAYLRPVRNRPNLVVQTGAQATRILFDGLRAVGLEYLVKGDRREARAVREIILSSGALHSPQLLMLSGIGDADALKPLGITPLMDLKGVGQGLQDHLAVSVKYSATQPISMSKYFSPVQGAIALGQYCLFRTGPLASPGMEAVGFVKSRPERAEPDVKLTLVMVLYRNNGREMIPEHGFSAHVNVATPESVGSLRLASADPLAPPVVDQNYLATDDDRRTMREGVRIARRVFNQPAFDPYRGVELEPGPDAVTDDQIDAFIRAKSEADYHTIGTCRMGSDPMAVVDDRLRVRGIEGLRVIDASVMPRLIGGNTNMATIMIAEKASDLILGR